MKKSKKLWINVLRWIILIPVAIIAYMLFKSLYGFFANLFISQYIYTFNDNLFFNDRESYDYIYQINDAQDFAGHFIIGPIYIFTREAISIILFIYVGRYFAPSHKKQVGRLLVILLILSSILFFIFMIKTNEYFSYTSETIIRIILEYLGMFLGAYISWDYLSEKSNSFKSSN